METKEEKVGDFNQRGSKELLESDRTKDRQVIGKSKKGHNFPCWFLETRWKVQFGVVYHDLKLLKEWNRQKSNTGDEIASKKKKEEMWESEANR